MTQRPIRDGLGSAIERAPARAHFCATGYEPSDLDRPIVAVATTWTETMPCNLNQRQLAAPVKAGIVAAGGPPLEFNTSAVSDNISMRTEGMRASLISREAIADSIELMLRASIRRRCLSRGCDKTVPAPVMALCRVDLPGVVPNIGAMAPGRWCGRGVTIQDVLGALGEHAAGRLTDADVRELEASACPGAGTCGGQCASNTMSQAAGFLGLVPVGAGDLIGRRYGGSEGARTAYRLAQRRPQRCGVRSGDVIVLSPDGSVSRRITTRGRLPTNPAFGLPGDRRIYVTEDELGGVESFEVGTDGLALHL